MRRLIVVKAGRCGGGPHLHSEQAAYMQHLLNSYCAILYQDGIENVRIVCGVTPRARESAKILAPLAAESRIYPVFAVSQETLSKSFEQTLGMARSLEDTRYDALIIVGEGELADRFPAVYGREVLGLDGLDDDPIIPTCSRMLNCENGTLALVY